MSEGQSVKDIIQQLQNLQLQQANFQAQQADLQVQQADLIAQLGSNLSTSEDTKAPSTTREFAIGDRVRIKNPRILQPQRGRIVKIGINRITVQTNLGTKIVRAPKNLVLER
jgi:predicted transcriptional regulator